MIKYEADKEVAHANFNGSVNVLAVEAAVLIKHIYDYIESQSEEDAKNFLDLLVYFVTDYDHPLYEPESHVTDENYSPEEGD